MSNFLAFVEEQFPTDISFGSIGGPEFKTIIVENQIGKEVRQIYSNFAKHFYEINLPPKNQIGIDKLLSFFHNRMGQAIGFRFKDWNDYKISGARIAEADGSQIQFQIHKIYQTLNSKIIRKISKPVVGTLAIHGFDKNQYSCNFATGLIKFHTPPKKGTEIVIDVEFDIPVRFATDKLQVKIINNDLRELQTVKLVEIIL